MPRHLMTVTIVRTDGTREQRAIQRKTAFREIEKILNATALDSVNLVNEQGQLSGEVMMVDDLGHQKELPINAEGTRRYHDRCRPGSAPPPIVGDVVFCWDRDFEDD